MSAAEASTPIAQASAVPWRSKGLHEQPRPRRLQGPSLVPRRPRLVDLAGIARITLAMRQAQGVGLVSLVLGQSCWLSQAWFSPGLPHLVERAITITVGFIREGDEIALAGLALVRRRAILFS